MHCPKCGSEATMEQKFCRSCGFGLGKVARLISEQAPDENLDSASDPNEDPSKSAPQAWLGFFFIMFGMCGIYMAASGRGGVIVGAVFTALFIVILALGSYVEFGSKRPRKQKPPRPASLTNAPATKKLPPQPDPEMNASVTEQTTANLAEKVER
jgi:hypothetical protein